MQWLADQYGVTAIEARKMVEQGEVDFGAFRHAIEKNIGGAALESGKTTKGAFANLGAALSRFGAGLISGVFPKIRGAFSGLTDLLDRFTPTAQRWGEAFSQFVAESLTKLSDWWAEHGPAIIARVKDIAKAIGSWLKDVVPAIRSWVQDVLGELSDWWDTWGPGITTFVKVLGTTIGAFATVVVRAVQLVHRNWDKLRIPFMVVAGLLTTVVVPAFIVVGVQAKIAAAKVALAEAAKVHSTAVATAKMSVHFAKIIAGWVVMGVQSLLHAAKVAAAWLIAMGPIALVIAAIVGLVAVIVANWDTIKAVIAAGWDAVKAATSAVWDAIKTAVDTAVGFLVDLFLNFTGPGLIIQHWETIKTATGEAWDWVQDKIQGFIDWFRRLPTMVSGIAGSIWRALKNGLQAVVDWILDKLDTILGPLDEIAAKIVDIFGSSVLGGAEGMSGEELVERIVRERAAGGPVRAGHPYIVGERGRELFVPGVSGMIMSNRQLMAAVASLPSGTGSAGPSGGIHDNVINLNYPRPEAAEGIPRALRKLGVTLSS